MLIKPFLTLSCEGFRRLVWLAGGGKAFPYQSSILEGERIVEATSWCWWRKLEFSFICWMLSARLVINACLKKVVESYSELYKIWSGIMKELEAPDDIVIWFSCCSQSQLWFHIFRSFLKKMSYSQKGNVKRCFSIATSIVFGWSFNFFFCFWQSSGVSDSCFAFLECWMQITPFSACGLLLGVI